MYTITPISGAKAESTPPRSCCSTGGMRRLCHATQEAALRYQHATDERDRTLAAGIDRLIQAAKADIDAPVVSLRSAGGGNR